MSTTRKTPKLRFPEFTGDWEQRKFGDMTIRESKTGESSKNLPCVEYEDVVCDNGVLNKDLSLKDAIKKGILFDGAQVLYGKLRPYLHNWLLPDFKGVAVGDWWVLRPKGVDKKFIYRLIQTQQFDDVTNLSSGSKMPRADWKLVSNTEFAIPCSTEEQMKIGLYFEHLDNLITLHQRELDSLKKLKKSLLQKMFPKNGEKIPELRFPEFTGDWKQRKFGDVLVSIQTGTNKLGSDRNSGQPLLKMGNLQSGYFDLSKLEFLENKAEPENIVKQGDFFFNTRNTLELVGKGATWFGESNKYAFNSNIARFTLKDVNTGFFNYLYNTNYVKKQIRARAMGTTSVAAIYPRSLKSVDIVIPNMEEQIKLSNLFMNLDSTITLHQRELDTLKKLKKGLLQNMFV